MIKMLINGKQGVYDLTSFLTENVTLTTFRKNSPSVLDFKFARDLVVQNKLIISIEEGNTVELTFNGNKIFKGFVFQKQRNKENIISVKCYDQIRYLQNKQSYTFVNKTASDIIKTIASEFGLITGDIVATEHILPPINIDNQRLLDIIMKGVDLTQYNNKKIYNFYDDVGELTLKEAKDMVTDIVFTDDTNITQFSYITSIDKATYNQVKLYKDNKKTGERELYIAKDNKTIGEWGVLQYYQKLEENVNTAQAQQLANDILAQKNKIIENLTIDVINIDKNIFLEKLRAGNYVYVFINSLGSKDFNKLCLIEKCTHTFSENEHTIKLELNGG